MMRPRVSEWCDYKDVVQEKIPEQMFRILEEREDL